MRKPFFVYGKTEMQFSSAVTAQLISTFDFATRIQSLFLLDLIIQVGPGQKPLRPIFLLSGLFVTASFFRFHHLELSRDCRISFLNVMFERLEL